MAFQVIVEGEALEAIETAWVQMQSCRLPAAVRKFIYYVGTFSNGRNLVPTPQNVWMDNPRKAQGRAHSKLQ